MTAALSEVGLLKEGDPIITDVSDEELKQMRRDWSTARYLRHLEHDCRKDMTNTDDVR
ncbi:hypothetical protein [Bifidobacterium lemurum]|uniref:hypothetical protein n=1 Tax=Bifidobacterium lemurum TaxID=1603886 RepID=UPI001356313B|nr:hypothetical protein [Bifidobacterium lemurum]